MPIKEVARADSRRGRGTSSPVLIVLLNGHVSRVL